MAKIKTLISLSEHCSRQLAELAEMSSTKTTKSAVVEYLIDQEYRQKKRRMNAEA